MIKKEKDDILASIKEICKISFEVKCNNEDIYEYLIEGFEPDHEENPIEKISPE